MEVEAGERYPLRPAGAVIAAPYRRNAVSIASPIGGGTKVTTMESCGGNIVILGNNR